MPNESVVPFQGRWDELPDQILLDIFRFLHPRSLLRASLCCKQWYRVAVDESLWKILFRQKFKLSPQTTTIAPGATSFLQEYRRLYWETPVFESESFPIEHKDQVLHVSFSHNGRYFATSSKDGSVKVWVLGYPSYVRYYEDMTSFNWQYTQLTQFNRTDTLLLVSGVHIGPNSTTGEIAVFSLKEGFELQCTVRNKPYDIFGTWYNNEYLLSGNLFWLGNFASCSVIYLNKSSQDLENIYESVVMPLYKFHNINASSIRTMLVADIRTEDEYVADDLSLIKRLKSVANQNEAHDLDMDQSESGSEMIGDVETGSVCEHRRTSEVAKMLSEVDCMQEENETNFAKNGKQETVFTLTGTGACSKVLTETASFDFIVNHACQFCRNKEGSQLSCPHSSASYECTKDNTPENETETMVEKQQSETETIQNETETETRHLCTESEASRVRAHPLPCRYGRGSTECSMSLMCPAVIQKTPSSQNSLHNNGTKSKQQTSDSHVIQPEPPTIHINKGDNDCVFPLTELPFCSSDADYIMEEPDRLLIFTTGTKTFTPHQIGIKRIKHAHALGKMRGQAERRRRHEARVKHLLSQQRRQIEGQQPSETANHSGPNQSEPVEDAELSLNDPGDFVLNEASGNEANVPDEAEQVAVLNGDLGAEMEAVLGMHEEENGARSDEDEPEFHMDQIDCVIEMDGHIIGLGLSPDQRYLYVNTRAWPHNFHIQDPLNPPPIALQIEVHVIDLLTFTNLGVIHRGHKAFTPNDECYFIFLDVSRQYLASGSEDKRGCLWDRHYGVLLHRFKHHNVVNCVAFQPTDEQVLVSVGDDNCVKIWRSRRHCREMGIRTSLDRNSDSAFFMRSSLSDNSLTDPGMVLDHTDVTAADVESVNPSEGNDSSPEDEGGALGGGGAEPNANLEYPIETGDLEGDREGERGGG